MANSLFSYEKMEQVEDYILEQLGLFVNDVTGLDVFLLDQPWPSEIKPSVGIRIIDYRDSGAWADTVCISEDETFYSRMNLRIVVEFFARSGRPMSNLALLIQALRGFQEERYLRLNSKGIGLLSVSNATPANTVFDGVETEKRARLTATFNVRIQAKDLVVIPDIKTIKGSIYTNVPAGENEYEADVLYNFYNGPLPDSEETQEHLKNGLRTAVFQNFQVDLITT